MFTLLGLLELSERVMIRDDLHFQVIRGSQKAVLEHSQRISELRAAVLTASCGSATAVSPARLWTFSGCCCDVCSAFWQLPVGGTGSGELISGGKGSEVTMEGAKVCEVASKRGIFVSFWVSVDSTSVSMTTDSALTEPCDLSVSVQSLHFPGEVTSKGQSLTDFDNDVSSDLISVSMTTDSALYEPCDITDSVQSSVCCRNDVW